MAGLKLFCSANGESLEQMRFGLFKSKDEAVQALGPSARYPNPDEMRHYWISERLYELNTSEIQTKLGITRQAVSKWREKAGHDMPRYHDYRTEELYARIREKLSPDLTAREIADTLHTTPATVLTVAELAGVHLKDKSHKKPDDDEIVRLAVGRTWRQLSEVCGVTLSTLRNYVYSDPDLRVKVRAVIVHEPSGGNTHGKLDVDEIVRMYGEGTSIYKIADRFTVQPMTIIYWLKKLGIYRNAETKGVVGR